MLHETLCTCLVFWTPHHHNTTAKVELMNWVLSEALSAFVNYRADNWDELIPLVEFEFNYLALVLDCCYTPFFMDQGQYPLLPMAPPGKAGASASSVGEDLAHLMDHVTGEVSCLLQEVQDAWKRGLDCWR